MKKVVGTTYTITITSNYYNSESDLDVSNGETIRTILDTEAVGKTSLQLKALTATDTENDFTGDNNGWSADDWQFTDDFYPSLKSYKTEGTDADGNPIQIEGELLCGQLPAADFVQCVTP